jgi:hypothetical protein
LSPAVNPSRPTDSEIDKSAVLPWHPVPIIDALLHPVFAFSAILDVQRSPDVRLALSEDG